MGFIAVCIKYFIIDLSNYNPWQYESQKLKELTNKISLKSLKSHLICLSKNPYNH